MRRERLHLSRYTSIETYRDWTGRVFIAYSSNASMLFRDAGELRKWLKLPKGVPSRDSFDSWIASLGAADAAKQKPSPKEGLSDELLATGFGPEVHLDESDPMDAYRQASADVSGVEVHLDESDPNYQTKMVT